ncbi:MAG: putative ABC transporter permease [Clostridia bacterium]|nr:putative ABC transporter permease [Clostridia bacterium]
MNEFIAISSLFFTGGFLGWIMEVFWRRFVSHRKEHKWINPGFLKGPILPIYGFGLAGLYEIKRILCMVFPQTWWATVCILAIMILGMTLIEYVGGIVFIKGLGIKLWDYSDQWGNIQGVICPLYSLFWGIVAVLYYFLIDPIAVKYVELCASWQWSLLLIGLLGGIALVDFAQSVDLSMRIRAFAKKHSIVVNFEKMKTSVTEWREQHKIRPKFVRFVTMEELKEGLQYHLDGLLKNLKDIIEK